MLLLFEGQLRRVIREELNKFMEAPQALPNSYTITSAAGGEIIMPNEIYEKFEAGVVKSFKDIL